MNNRFSITGLGLPALFLIALSAAGCSDSSGGGECLGHGENCTQAYKESEYGTTDVYCCDGSCTSGQSSGVLICQ